MQIRVFGKYGSYLIVNAYSDEDYDVLGLSRHAETGESFGNLSLKLFKVFIQPWYLRAN